MIRQSLGKSRYTAAADNDVVFGRTKTFSFEETKGVVFCHGSGENAISTVEKKETRDLMYGLAKNATVVAPDLGLQTWGNDTAITRIGEAIAYLRSTWGVEGEVALVTGSMGTAGAMAYANAHPEDVKLIASVIPLISIADIMVRGAGAEVNAAYGGAYDDVVDGPDHSPIQMVNTLDPTMPIGLWAARDDTLTPFVLAEQFNDLRPQTSLRAISSGGHSLATVATAMPEMLEFVKYYL